MGKHYILFSLTLPLSIVFAAPTNTSAIIWGPCDFEVGNGTQCGILQVPLDYTDTSSRTTHSLELVRVPAIQQPSRGSIIVNFGGPGAEGIVNLGNTQSAPVFHDFLSEDHDMIGFNARGTSKKYMRFACYETEEERMMANFPNPLFTFPEGSDGSKQQLWTAGKALAATCYANNDTRDIGELIGSAFTARDVIQIVDALGQGPLLKFYGPSYGSALGATIAAMFPDRVGAIILDGMLNPHEYFHTLTEPEMVVAADAAFTAFLSSCIKAGPARCSLARHSNTTAASLERSIYDLLDGTKYNPILLPAAAIRYDVIWASYVLDYSSFKNLLASTFFHPSNMRNMADALAGLLYDGVVNEAFITWRDTSNGIFGNAFQVEAHPGIRCSDKGPELRLDSIDHMIPLWDEVANVSRLGGNAAFDHSQFHTPCASWPFVAKERYTGDFRVKTRNPVLIVNNRWDSVTPLQSAFNISKSLEGSAVLVQETFGHTALAWRSNCTFDYVKEYVRSGNVPQNGTICQGDIGLFESPLFD